MRYTIDYSFGKDGIFKDTINQKFRSWKKMERFINKLQEEELDGKELTYYAYDKKTNKVLAIQ